MVESSIDRQKQLEFWFQSALGRSLLADQRLNIEQKIQSLFGFHQAELAVSHRVPVGNPSSLGHKFYILPKWEQDLPENTIISTADEIALDSDMVDLVILHHTLDFSKNPHQALREASRILKSSGHLMLVGFNPLSSWGGRKLIKRSKGSPWNNRFISGSRVEDWLTLLGFKVSGVDYHFYGLPFNHQGLMKQFSWLNKILNSKVPLGAYYTILAQKQVGSGIKVSPVWRQRAKVVGMPLSKASNSRTINVKSSIE